MGQYPRQKKELASFLTLQLAAIEARIQPGKPYVLWCQQRGEDRSAYEVPYPHYYLIVWLECEQRKDANGIRPYPKPTLSWGEQDAETMLAFEVLDAIRQEVQRTADLTKRARELAHEYASTS